MTDRENRELGPEMLAEGWFLIGGDTMIWFHGPSHRVVKIDGPWPRESFIGTPNYFDEVSGGPKEPVYHVSVSEYDEDSGEPTDGYSGFLTTSYALALRSVREMRQRILDEAPKFEPVKQLSFDDLLGRKTVEGGAS